MIDITHLSFENHLENEGSIEWTLSSCCDLNTFDKIWQAVRCSPSLSFVADFINPLAPGGFDHSLKLGNFKLISAINILSIFCEIAISWIPQHLTDH